MRCRVRFLIPFDDRFHDLLDYLNVQHQWHFFSSTNRLCIERGGGHVEHWTYRLLFYFFPLLFVLLQDGWNKCKIEKNKIQLKIKTDMLISQICVTLYHIPLQKSKLLKWLDSWLVDQLSWLIYWITVRHGDWNNYEDDVMLDWLVETFGDWYTVD